MRLARPQSDGSKRGVGWGYEDERMYRDFVYLSVTVVWYGPLSRPVRQLASESVSKPASQAFFFRFEQDEINKLWNVFMRQ